MLLPTPLAASLVPMTSGEVEKLYLVLFNTEPKRSFQFFCRIRLTFARDHTPLSDFFYFPVLLYSFLFQAPPRVILYESLAPESVSQGLPLRNQAEDRQLMSSLILTVDLCVFLSAFISIILHYFY
jgi:hypothetical protein